MEKWQPSAQEATVELSSALCMPLCVTCLKSGSISLSLSGQRYLFSRGSFTPGF